MSGGRKSGYDAEGLVGYSGVSLYAMARCRASGAVFSHDGNVNVSTLFEPHFIAMFIG
jgi:hypothetical protein